MFKRSIKHAGLNTQVVANEVNRVRTVSCDATDFGSSQNNDIGLVSGDVVLGGFMVAQIQRARCFTDEVGVATCLQCAPDSATHQALMACHVDAIAGLEQVHEAPMAVVCPPILCPLAHGSEGIRAEAADRSGRNCLGCGVRVVR